MTWYLLRSQILANLAVKTNKFTPWFVQQKHRTSPISSVFSWAYDYLILQNTLTFNFIVLFISTLKVQSLLSFNLLILSFYEIKYKLCTFNIQGRINISISRWEWYRAREDQSKARLKYGKANTKAHDVFLFTFLLSHIHYYFLCFSMNIYVHHIHVLIENSRGHQIPQNWKWLLATIQVMGTKPSPRQEQPVLLPSELSLYLPPSFLFLFLILNFQVY